MTKQTDKATALTSEQISIGLLKIGDYSDCLNGREGLENTDEIIDRAMQIVNEYDALNAVAEAAKRVLSETAWKLRDAAMENLSDKLLLLAAIRKGKVQK